MPDVLHSALDADWSAVSMRTMSQRAPFITPGWLIQSLAKAHRRARIVVLA
ncbi:MAG: hypothetical protein ACYTGW_09525 [Planctomycetota bacterium]|jgi:hypothetical protein